MEKRFGVLRPNMNDQDYIQNLAIGKIFGGRGRGFPQNRNELSETKVGGLIKNTSNREGDELYGSSGFRKNENKSDRHFGLSNVCRNEVKDHVDWIPKHEIKKNISNIKFVGVKTFEENDKYQKPEIYIPAAPTENDEEIFGNCISSGNNFSKLDDIEVKVSGENAPSPINSFEEAGLNPFMMNLIKKCTYRKPTPIQKYSIPIILNGRDMLACAQTGSGKTAAFLIPIINTLLDEKNTSSADSLCKPQALIMSPTRELGIQIFNEARKFSRGTNLKVVIVYGGTSILYQKKSIDSGCDILVATPGRLLDFLTRGLVNFSELKFLVLDEADRMLDIGFLPVIRKIFEHPTMSQRQTLLYSATFPDEVQNLARMFLTDYLFVAVGIIGSACTDVLQRFYEVKKFDKRNKLVEVLQEEKGLSKKTLVFVKQKRITDFIATFLCEKNFPATSIHGDREQREREEALRDFKSGKMNILVATSVAARGLDIQNVNHVINYDLPNSVDEYVHRIGRTGRVGNLGLATSFYERDQDAALASSLVKILRQAGQEVPDFLKEGNSGEADLDIISNFGGRDFRENSLGCAELETFEDEVW